MTKGISNVMAVMALAIVTIVAVGAGFGFSQLATVKPTPTVEADGEWDQIYAPDKVAGSDLSITEQTISDDGTYRVTNTTTDLNGTDGQTSYLFYGIEVSSNRLDDVEITGALESPTTTSELQIRKAYIVSDEEGMNLDSEDAIYNAQVETEQDEFSFDISSLPEGEYVIGAEVKGINTDGIASNDALLKIEYDADTDDNVDSFTQYIYNA